MVIKMIINVDKLLKNNLIDEVIIFQTDTVYGIGCLISSQKGVNKIYEIKNREAKKPLAILCANISQVKELVNEFEIAEKYANKYWPGALTMIFNKSELVGDFITASHTVGIRIPNDEIALKILNEFGPMAVTSLNISALPPILKYEDALVFENKVDFIVKGTDLSGVSSTVYDVINNKILRQGEIKID